VFHELHAAVAALDRLGLSLKLTFNGGALAAQYRYERRDTMDCPSLSIETLYWKANGVVDRAAAMGSLPLVPRYISLLIRRLHISSLPSKLDCPMNSSILRLVSSLKLHYRVPLRAYPPQVSEGIFTFEPDEEPDPER
jgi:hypothetical protein